MLAYLLFLFAALTTIGLLAVIGTPRTSGGMKVFLTIYNTALIVVLVLAALHLTG